MEEAIKQMTGQIHTQMIEDEDNFIYKSIEPFCSNIMQRTISKKELSDALRLWRNYEKGVCYVVVEGEYSSQEVVAVSFDKEVADAYADLSDWCATVYEIPIISDRTLVTRANSRISKYSKLFIIENGYELHSKMSMWSMIEPTEDDRGVKLIEGSDTTFTIEVFGADTQEKAEKIAYDRAYKYIAEKLGL